MSARRPSPRRRRWRRWHRISRDLVLFTAGLFGLIYEVVRYPHPDPGALVACTTVLISPAVMRYDEWGRKDRDQK